VVYHVSIDSVIEVLGHPIVIHLINQNGYQMLAIGHCCCCCCHLISLSRFSLLLATWQQLIVPYYVGIHVIYMRSYDLNIYAMHYLVLPRHDLYPHIIIIHRQHQVVYHLIIDNEREPFLGELRPLCKKVATN
jgi:hypothetical protein